jgi:hypothetical protein
MKIKRSELETMITECIEKSLVNENDSEETMSNSLTEDISFILSKLNGLIEKGYIVFTSPHPSSTEKAIKDRVLKAMELLENAKILSYNF